MPGDLSPDPLQLETARLRLCRLTAGDAPFILRLVNDPDWLRYIGDKGVHNLDDARRYIESGPAEMYDLYGHGLLRVELRATGEPLGLCGLLKRQTLEHVDLGFAFLPEHRGQGYAYEAASAVLASGRAHLGLTRILAITNTDNHVSGRLLEKLGFRRAGLQRLADSGEEVLLFMADHS